MLLSFNLFSWYLFTLFLSYGQVDVSNAINYTIKDGLPSNTVYTVVQDDQGFIWFGTDAGLSRFDGLEFKNYGLREGLPDMDILNFYKDSQGRIWFFTFNGKVGYLKNGNIHNSTNTALLINADLKSRITSVQEKDGIVFISSQKDGVKIVGRDGLIDSLIGKEFDYRYIALIDSVCYFINEAFDLDFVDANDYRRDILKESNIKSNIKFKHTTYSYVLTHGQFIYGISRSLTNHYIIRLDTKTGLVRLFWPNDFTVYNFSIIEDELYVFSDKGIQRINFDKNTSYNYIEQKEATKLINDTHGNRWISTLNRGVILLPKRPVERILSDRIYEASGLSQMGDSLLYVVYNQSNIGTISESADREFSHKFQVPDKSKLKTLYVDSTFNVWTLYTSSSLRRNGNLFTPAYRSSNTSFLKNESFVFHHNTIFEYFNTASEEKQSFPPQDIGKIWDMAFISKNELLIASSKGLHVMNLRDTTVEALSRFKGMPFNSILIDKHNSIWLAAHGLGLIRMPIDIIKHSEDVDLLKAKVESFSNVYTKLLLVDSVVYAAAPNGIAKIHFDAEKFITTTFISEANGLSPSKTNSLEYFDGSIYVAQDNGLFSFSHNENFEESLAYPVIIDEVISADSTLSPMDLMASFPYDVGLIQVNAKAIYYKDHKNLSYQFKLIRSREENEDWTTSPNNEFLFSNLDPGNYTFQIRVKSINSSWTEPTSFSFEIGNVYWKTLWFKLLIAALLILVISLAIINSIRSKQRKQRLSRQKIESDLKALKAQINPHFLFNSLNSIHSFILERENELAEDYLLKYGQLMRNILNHSNELTVTIGDEVKAIKLYVQLEVLRVDQSIDFDVDVLNLDDHLDRVPSMIIQPLVENAIWHGIQPMDRPGKLTLTFEGLADIVKVTLEDNGEGFDQLVKRDAPHGIQLVKERIDLVNRLKNQDSSFTIESSKTGTKVTFSYPKDLI